MEEIIQMINNEIEMFENNLKFVKNQDTLMRVLRSTQYLNDSLNYFLNKEDETKI